METWEVLVLVGACLMAVVFAATAARWVFEHFLWVVVCRMFPSVGRHAAPRYTAYGTLIHDSLMKAIRTNEPNGWEVGGGLLTNIGIPVTVVLGEYFGSRKSEVLCADTQLRAAPRIITDDDEKRIIEAARNFIWGLPYKEAEKQAAEVLERERNKSPKDNEGGPEAMWYVLGILTGLLLYEFVSYAVKFWKAAPVPAPDCCPSGQKHEFGSPEYDFDAETLVRICWRCHARVEEPE